MSHNVWKDTMVACMGRYCDKITININKAVAEGFKLIVESNAPNMPRLIKKLVNEKDKSLLWLQCRCAEMDSLIEEVMTKGGNSSLKQQVLDLLKTDKLPHEIIAHILSYSSLADPDSAKNCRTTCTTLYNILMPQKSHYIIKALPASDLESLLTTLKRSKKQQIELTIRAPTLSLKQVPNKFMNALTSLTHLKGMDISKLDLPEAALTKLVRMTNLERLTIGPSFVILSPLSNLTKLTLRNVDSFPEMWQALTNLQDLSLQIGVSDLDKVNNFTKLTRLHFGMLWMRTTPNIALTTLTNLKDLNIEVEWTKRLAANFSAASTRLEALDIDLVCNDVDIDWIVSNTRLTRFHFKCGYKLSDRFYPLTKLHNISSLTIFNSDQLLLFTALEHLTHLKADYSFNDDFEIAQEKFTSLQSLEGGGYQTRDFANTFSNLTKITWMPIINVTTAFPLNVRELTTNHLIKNMTGLTKLESLTMMKPQVFEMDASKMVHLTKICLQNVNAQPALWILPKLSNLFALRELSVTTVNNYQGLDADFLITLTNLEALSIPSLNIPVHVFDKIVNLHTQLTQLRISCSESNGEILTRLNNLQVLEFYSSKPMKGLQKMLEENLPRLTAEVRVK